MTYKKNYKLIDYGIRKENKFQDKKRFQDSNISQRDYIKMNKDIKEWNMT